ncbi:MarR family winged helix-turn-helix transcriptional regulator [Streptomyces sparsogenes]|uniref:MarR family winged helix-turn-helix transcriptional regulator n=1 Tax=Streptomyces sparsogenes TaxID=67365 RepID=UPI003F4D562B
MRPGHPVALRGGLTRHPDAGRSLRRRGRGRADGATASELGRRLGISKQAAGKTADRLEALGYAVRADDPADARRKVIRPTPRGMDSLAGSAAIFEELRAQWAAALGPERLRDLQDDLSVMVPRGALRLDAAGWFGA